MKRHLLCFLMVVCGVSFAHEMTPTYPHFKPYYLPGIQYTTMSLFNRREDVEYYMIGVFDSEWESVPYATRHRVIKLRFLERGEFDVFVKDEDLKKVRYICSTSLISSSDKQITAVSSKICSKVK